MEETDIDPIANALGIDPISLPVIQQSRDITPIPPEEKEESNPDQDQDYRLTRSTIRDMIVKGSNAIDGISDLAKDLESPRAYEVMATMMKTISDMSKDLLDVHGKTKELKSTAKRVDETNITVDKAVFVGTTTDLLKRLKNDNT